MLHINRSLVTEEDKKSIAKSSIVHISDDKDKCIALLEYQLMKQLHNNIELKCLMVIISSDLDKVNKDYVYKQMDKY